ncbi:class I SAM-dependent methyltransferase [Aestuariimicrobium ganziense]|uniref:class I SAM-dependent methyltransferase n=1 Tax=Aestuariimicrobium ganziense TaxID=2773677 RepID=UPI00194332ED|nr:class I SAM-dependent methyltransferase [Aestuariimicrobium ganziense]
MSSPYRGAAPHYVRGRVPYPAALFTELAGRLGLNGTRRLLDLGCGPGSLTLPLARLVGRAVGVDVDGGMLAVAAHQAALAGIGNVTWLRCRAEDLPADLGEFDLVTLAQSFHWMHRPVVAELAHRRLRGGGALVHVHATTHEGVGDPWDLPHPTPPRDAIRDLVGQFVDIPASGGPTPPDQVGAIESPIYAAAGFHGPERFTVTGEVVERTTDEVISSVLSLSWASPGRLGEHQAEVETGIRALLADASPTGTFSERMSDVVVDIWRR